MIMGSGLYRAGPDTGLGAVSSAAGAPAASACPGPDGGAAGCGLSGVFRRLRLPMGRRADGGPASAALPGNATGRREPGRLRARPLAARGLAAGLLVAVAALLALPLQAQAQKTTFVSNTGQSTATRCLRGSRSPPDIGSFFYSQAQRFSTGSNEGGYTLSAIQVQADNFESASSAKGEHLHGHIRQSGHPPLRADQSGNA